MESAAILNARDLQLEINRLKGLESVQKASLAVHFSSPSAIFATAKSVFTKRKNDGSPAGTKRPDLLTIISRFVLPFTLNRTIFRHSNFLVKGLVWLAAKKAAGLVTQNTVGKLLKSGKTLFAKIFAKSSASDSANTALLTGLKTNAHK